MKKFFVILLALSLLALPGCDAIGSVIANNSTGGKFTATTTQPAAPEQSPTAPAGDATQDPSNSEGDKFMNKIYATITMDDGGVIKLELYPDLAPQSVRNFCYLARQGFYDGLTFHRIIPGFMIQGGDPEGTGRGGPGYRIKGEFAQNGFINELKHTRGVISWARQSMPLDSAGSQFFIMHADAPHLDGAYAAFGKVIEGIDVVDRIAATKTSIGDRPVTPVVIKTITIDGPELPEPDKIK